MKPKPKQPVRVVPARKPGTLVVTSDDGWFDYEFRLSVAKACQVIDPVHSPSVEGVELVLQVLEKRGYIVVP